jgi:formylglycine-generating enzyme required for sulfatase activity
MATGWQRGFFGGELMLFLSYSHDDRDEAANLQKKLVKAGVACWRDEGSLRIGDDFAAEITRAIRTCDALVLLLSPASNNADYVLKEVAMAYSLGKPILPVELRQTDVSDALLPYIVRLHRISAAKPVSAFVDELKSQLGQQEQSVVRLPGFQTEERAPSNFVTNQEYGVFMRTSYVAAPADWQGSGRPRTRPEDPVSGVSWSEAVAYCDWAGGCLPDCPPQRPSSELPSGADGVAPHEWRMGGDEQHKYVVDAVTSEVVAMTEPNYQMRGVQFRCLPVASHPTRSWVHVDDGWCEVGTHLEAFLPLAEAYRLLHCDQRHMVARPRVQKRLHAFAISEMCVTNEEYYQFTSAMGRKWPSYWDSCWLSQFQRPFPPRLQAQPVTNVTAEQAREYCIWSRLRLPSWHEWQRVAGGEGCSPYPWGPDYNEQLCNSRESGLGSLARVDDYASGDTSEGARQMCGNVAEWTVGPDGESELRGGSWRLPCEVWGLTSVFKRVTSDYRAVDVGFRVVADA